MQLAYFSKQTNFDDSYFRFVPVSKMRSIFLRSLCPVGRQAGWLKKSLRKSKEKSINDKELQSTKQAVCCILRPITALTKSQ